MPYYDERDELWESIPAIEFLDFDERNELDWHFTQLLDDVEFRHMTPQNSEHWQPIMDMMGFANNGDVWDWQVFKEWYNSA